MAFSFCADPNVEVPPFIPTQSFQFALTMHYDFLSNFTIQVFILVYAKETRGVFEGRAGKRIQSKAE